MQNTTGDMQDSQDEPGDTYPNAGRDSGYVAPIGENIVNVVTGLLAAIETKLLLQGQQLRGDIADLAKQQAIADRARLDRNAQFQEQLDARFDKVYESQDALAAAVQEGAAAAKKSFSDMAGRLQALETSMGESQDDRQQIHSEIAGVDTKVVTLQERLEGYIAGSRRAEIDQIKADIRELRGPELSSEQRAHYVAILMKMIAEWERTHPDDLA